MTAGPAGADFAGYVAANGRSLERYAYVLTGQPAAAQDLVQTALMKAYRRWRRISRLEHPDAYVRRILTNCFLDQRRRRRDDEPMAEVPDGAGGADPADAVVTRDEIVRALRVLSPHQRAVIVLRHFLALDDNAIAAEIGCSASTVRSHATRGLQRMRNTMHNAEADSPAPADAPAAATAPDAQPRRRHR